MLLSVGATYKIYQFLGKLLLYLYMLNTLTLLLIVLLFSFRAPSSEKFKSCSDPFYWQREGHMETS